CGVRRHVPHGNGLACTARPVLCVTGGDNGFEAGNLLGEWSHRLDEVWRGEAQACPRVFEDVGELTSVQLGVHWRRGEASMPHRIQNLDILRAITHGERHAVPWLETAAVCQCPGELCHPIAQGPIGETGLWPKRHGRPFSKRPGRFREEAGDVHAVTSLGCSHRSSRTAKCIRSISVKYPLADKR